MVTQLWVLGQRSYIAGAEHISAHVISSDPHETSSPARRWQTGIRTHVHRQRPLSTSHRCNHSPEPVTRMFLSFVNHSFHLSGPQCLLLFLYVLTHTPVRSECRQTTVKSFLTPTPRLHPVSVNTLSDSYRDVLHCDLSVPFMWACL